MHSEQPLFYYWYKNQTSLGSDYVSELQEWQQFVLAMANNLIVINGSTLKTLGEIAPLHRANTTQILDHWSVLKSLNAHDLYSLHNCQYTWISCYFSISTSLNCGHLCSQTAARTKVYCCRGTARCTMSTAENQDYFQWLQHVCGEVLAFKPYTKISFSYFFTVLPVSRRSSNKEGNTYKNISCKKSL